MIRVLVLYPHKEGARFDHEYYEQNHMPFLRKKLEPLGMVRAEVDRGITGGAGQPAPFVAAAHLIFETTEQFQQAFASTSEELLADIPNYTDLEPQIQISQMVD